MSASGELGVAVVALIEWTQFKHHTDFDRAVEMFFVNEYGDESGDTFAVNGRGGDEGIDIHIRHGGKFVIAQLKYFPEGFSGEWRKSRQTQIRRSYKSALVHKPDEWWLVVPTTLTPGERRYVQGLAGSVRAGGPGPSIRVFDQTQLDILAARHRDLVGLLLGDETAEAVRVLGLGDVGTLSQDDIVARVAGLARQSAKQDENWRWDLYVEDGLVGRKLVTKNPFAAQRSPIELRFTAKFGPDHTDLRDRFDDALRFGSPGQVDLPASVVTSFEVDGPALVARKSENVELSFVTDGSRLAGRPFTVTLTDTAGRHVATYHGATSWAARAFGGASVHAVFDDAVTLQFKLPDDPATSDATMNVTVDLAGCEPSGVVRAVGLLEHLDRDHTVTLKVDGHQLGRLTPGPAGQSVFGANRAGILAHRDVAADLVVVQEATSTWFTYPAGVEPSERIFLRCVRRLVEGKCVVWPETFELTATLNGTDGPQLRALLAAAGSLGGGTDEFTETLFGHDFELGKASFYVPKYEIVDADDIVAAVDAGNARGRPVTVRVADGYGFWVYLTDRFVPDPGDRIRPVSLGLDDYPDAPDVARALEAPPG